MTEEQIRRIRHYNKQKSEDSDSQHFGLSYYPTAPSLQAPKKRTMPRAKTMNVTVETSETHESKVKITIGQHKHEKRKIVNTYEKMTFPLQQASGQPSWTKMKKLSGPKKNFKKDDARKPSKGKTVKTEEYDSSKVLLEAAVRQSKEEALGQEDKHMEFALNKSVGTYKREIKKRSEQMKRQEAEWHDQQEQKRWDLFIASQDKESADAIEKEADDLFGPAEH